MSFTDQKPRIATEQDVTAPWAGAKNGKYFRCYLCGHKFKVGDQYRFVFGQTLGNFMVCQDCDSEDIMQKWASHHAEWEKLRNGKFWYFVIPIEDAYDDEKKEASREARETNEEIKYWKDKAYESGSGICYD